METSTEDKLRHLLKNKKILGIAAVILLIVGGILGYVHYRHTPKYTLSLIQDAVKSHDWETFSRHVDMDMLTSSTYDQMADYFFSNDQDLQDSPFARNLVQGMVISLKPSVVESMKEGARDYIKTGKLNGAQETENAGNEADQAARNLEKKSGIYMLTLKDVTETEKADGLASVGLKFHSVKLNHDFTIRIKMRQLQDGTWEVVSIENLKEYLKEFTSSYQAALDKANKPIQKKIDSQIKITGLSAEIVPGDEFGFSKHLVITGQMKLSGNKVINKIDGIIKARENNGKVQDIFFNNIEIEPDSDGTGSEEFGIGRELNPFIESDKKLEDMNLSALQLTCHVSRIVYSDGSTLELKTSLN